MARIRRNKYEQIEDAFADLPTEEQAAMLETLTSLHRWCKRERARKPEQQERTAAELLERGRQLANGAPIADPDATLDLAIPEDHEQ